MKKVLLLISILLLGLSSYSQYFGGSADGFTLKTLVSTDTVPFYNKFTGGSSDGFTVKTLTSADTVPFYNKFTGGDGCGFVMKELSQTSTVSYYNKFTGGTSDGFAMGVIEGYNDSILRVSDTTVSLANDANSTTSVEVTSNIAWSVITDQTWLSVSPDVSIGNATLVLTAEENTTSAARTATVTITGSATFKRVIKVTQATVLQVIKDSIYAYVKEDSISVNIISNTSWTAVSDQRWLTVYPASGNGDVTLTFELEDNPTIYPRIAKVTITAANVADQVISITQAAGDAILSLSETVFNINATSTDITSIMTSNTTWNASSNQTWLTVSPASNTGNGILTITAEANAGTTRTATVTISATGTESQTIVITQAGYTNTDITLGTLEIPDPGCEGSFLLLDYTVLGGVPAQYKIIFGETALLAGFANTSYTTLSSHTSTGTIIIPIPSGTADGTYSATLQMENSSHKESQLYPFNFTINISSDYIISKFDDVILCNNSSGRFIAYQWYKDGSEIAGATKQYYCDPNGLEGSYSVKVTTTNGQELFSCSKEFDISPTSEKSISVYPNPAVTGQSCMIRITGISNDELKGAKLTIYSITGYPVYYSEDVKEMNSISFNSIESVYVGQVITSQGKSLAFRIIVSK